MFLREGRIEIVFRRDERCGQHRKTAVLLFLAVRRRCHFEASARTVCVMLDFTLTLILAVMVALYSWTPCIGELLHREEPASKLNDKRSPAHWNGRSDWGFAPLRW